MNYFPIDLNIVHSIPPSYSQSHKIAATCPDIAFQESPPAN